MLRLLKFISGAVVIATVMSTAPHAESVVNVTLIDKIGSVDLSKPMKLGMGMKGDMKMAKMAININPTMVARGHVKFNVTNLAGALVHEVIVAQVNDENELLSFDAVKNEVDEHTIHALGQVAEIYPQ